METELCNLRDAIIRAVALTLIHKYNKREKKCSIMVKHMQNQPQLQAEGIGGGGVMLRVV